MQSFHTQSNKFITRNLSANCFASHPAQMGKNNDLFYNEIYVQTCIKACRYDRIHSNRWKMGEHLLDAMHATAHVARLACAQESTHM